MVIPTKYRTRLAFFLVAGSIGVLMCLLVSLFVPAHFWAMLAGCLLVNAIGAVGRKDLPWFFLLLPLSLGAQAVHVDGKFSYSVDGGTAMTITGLTGDRELTLIEPGWGIKLALNELSVDPAIFGSNGNGLFDFGNHETYVPTGMKALLSRLTFHHSLLHLDSVGRVGINTTSPQAALHVKSRGQIEVIIEDSLENSPAGIRLIAHQALPSAVGMIEFYNGDYRHSSIVAVKQGTGSRLDFKAGYSETLSDNVLQIHSRESGASAGLFRILGGVRKTWAETSETLYNLNTGNYGLVMHQGGTVILPQVSADLIGQEFEVFNASDSIVTLSCGESLIYGTVNIPQGTGVYIKAPGTFWATDLYGQ